MGIYLSNIQNINLNSVVQNPIIPKKTFDQIQKKNKTKKYFFVVFILNDK